MKKALYVAGALVLLPSIGHAQEFAPLPGFYIGAGVGGAWYLNSTTTVGGIVFQHDGFVGRRRRRLRLRRSACRTRSRLWLHPLHRQPRQHRGAIEFQRRRPISCRSWARCSTISFRRRRSRPTSVPARAWPSSTATPSWATRCSPTRASSAWATTSTASGASPSKAATSAPPTPNVIINGVNVGVNNYNIVAMVYGQYKFAPPTAAAPPPAPPAAAPPSFMVFFDWDSSSLSEASLNVVQAGVDGASRARAAPASGDRSHRHVGSRGLQHGAVAASRECGQGCAGPRRRAGRRDHGHRPRRSRACWSRPPTACASRRTVASRSSSTRRSFRLRDSRRSKIAAPRVISPGRLTPHLDGVGDELQLAVGYGRCRLAAECGAQDPVELPTDRRSIAYEARRTVAGVFGTSDSDRPPGCRSRPSLTRLP